MWMIVLAELTSSRERRPGIDVRILLGFIRLAGRATYGLVTAGWRSVWSMTNVLCRSVIRALTKRKQRRTSTEPLLDKSDQC